MKYTKRNISTPKNYCLVYIDKNLNFESHRIIPASEILM